MLDASAELRHPHNDDHYWRESLYFNLADPVNRLGLWLYVWTVPNQSLPAGILVCLYSGQFDDRSITRQAMRSPRHVLRSGEDWIYCYMTSLPEQLAGDFDSIDIAGLQLTQVEALRRYAIDYDDGEGTALHLDCDFVTPPWDYSDGPTPIPDWLATNRYHRAWRARGSAVVASSAEMIIDARGDSDHSWGRRDTLAFAKHNFKMWSFQSPDGRVAASAVKLGDDTFLGYLHSEGRSEAIRSIRDQASYSTAGLQSDMKIELTDSAGRRLTGYMPAMFAHIGYGGGRSDASGYEGVGTFDVEAVGPCHGLTSFCWPHLPGGAVR